MCSFVLCTRKYHKNIINKIGKNRNFISVLYSSNNCFVFTCMGAENVTKDCSDTLEKSIFKGYISASNLGLVHRNRQLWVHWRDHTRGDHMFAEWNRANANCLPCWHGMTGVFVQIRLIEDNFVTEKGSLCISIICKNKGQNKSKIRNGSKKILRAPF